MAVRGKQQQGRTGQFPPDKLVRAVLPLQPDDPVRPLYENLVREMGVSGAEVLRAGLLALADRHAEQ